MSTFLALADRSDELLAARTRRDQAIRDAALVGYSLRVIAAEVLLSHEQVRTIIAAQPAITTPPR